MNDEKGTSGGSFGDLWRVDDEDWIRERKAQWVQLEKTVFGRSSKREKQALKRHFLGGVNASSLLRGQTPYDPCVDCVDYFVSALGHATNPAHRDACHVDELLELARDVAGDDGAGDIAREFARALIAREAEVREHWAKSA